MSGYKAGYSEQHSPTYAQGMDDGTIDADRISQCPPLPPIGPKLDGRMYKRGYDLEFKLAVPHICTESCKQAAR